MRGSADGEPPVLPKAQGFMSLRDVLLRYREKIVREWVDQLHPEISDRYSRRSLDELIPLFSEAVDANFFTARPVTQLS